MEDAVGKEEVLLDDARLVYEQRVVRKGNSQVAAVDTADSGFVVDISATVAAHTRKTVGQVRGVVWSGV